MLTGCNAAYLSGTLPPNLHLSKFSMTNSCSKLPITGSSCDDSCDESLSEHRSNVIRMKSFGSTISIPRCKQQQQQTFGGTCVGHLASMHQLSSSQHHLPPVGDYGGPGPNPGAPCSETVTITTKVS